jgi:hypothetical protein
MFKIELMIGEGTSIVYIDNEKETWLDEMEDFNDYWVNHNKIEISFKIDDNEDVLIEKTLEMMCNLRNKELNYATIHNIEMFEDSSLTFQKWCENVGLDYSVLMYALEKRNDIIEELYSMNINPYKNESYKLKTILTSIKSKDEILHLINNIKNIKKCIYGGYYNNLLHLNDSDNSYYNNQNIKIKLSEPFIKTSLLKNNNFSEYKAKWIVSNSIRFEAIKSPNMEILDPLLYSIQAENISILDGFIYPDFEFSSPKCKL